MQIDIRETDDTFISAIKFGEGEALLTGDEDDGLLIIQSDGHSLTIYQESIPNLIKALHKARELW